MGFLAPLFSLILPFILWPIEQALPYPYIIEEIAKGSLTYWVLKNPRRASRIKAAIAIGALYAFSESVLYIFNIFAVGNLSTLFQRLAITIPLHIITTLVILLPALKDKRLIVVGVILAGIIHYLFNFEIAKYRLY
jgi:hypothetical protein